MTIRNYILYTFIPAIFFLLGCEKEIPFKGETQQPLLVIHAFLSPYDSIYIHASRSRGISDLSAVKKIDNATIKILNGTEVVANFIYEKLGYYKPIEPFYPVAGINYKIEASAPDLPTVHAYETIPFINDFAITPRITNNNNLSKTVNFDITLNDPSKTADYYSIKVYRIDSIYQDSSMVEVRIEPVFCTTTDPSIENIDGLDIDIGDGQNKYDQFFLRDDLFNGKNYRLTLKDSWNYTSDYPKTFVIEVNFLSEAYFNHTISKIKYLLTEDDPFSQPVQIYSNVENGLGIFAGHSTYRKPIRVKFAN